MGSRPGFNKFLLNFDFPATQNAFESGYFQGASFYSNPVYDQPSIMVSVSGVVYRIQLLPQYGQVSPLKGFTNSTRAKKAYFCEADAYMVIQDGESKPLIFDGAKAIRATPTQVPVGTIMAYGQGRLFVTVGNTAVRAGDIFGTGIGSVLNFTETDFLAEGGDFGPPPSMGPITNLTFQATQDTATGQGPLLLMGSRGCMSFNVQQQRLQWKTGSFGVQALVNTGALGPNLAAIVNGDLWYRAYDGWRSYRSARAEISKWAQQSLSNEVAHRLVDESLPIIDVGSAVTFDNKLIATLMPQQGTHGIYHLGFLVLDFHPISTVQPLNEYRYTQAVAPAWTDMWTGLQPYQILKGTVHGVERCFALVLETNKLALYELSLNDPFDNFGAQNQRIVSSVELRAANFQKDDDEKKLCGGDLWFSDLAGQIDLKVQYRPDEYPLWYDWHETAFDARYSSDDLSDVLSLDLYQKPFFPRLQLPNPPEIDDTNTGRVSTRGYTFQMRLEITGAWQISRIRLIASVEAEKTKYQEANNP